MHYSKLHSGPLALAVGAMISVGAIFATSDASATVVGFDDAGPVTVDGFMFDPARIVSGNCLSGDCLALNNNELTVMTAEDGGKFALNEIWFKFIGGSSDRFTVASATETATFLKDDFGNNDDGHFVSFGDTFAEVEEITFTMGASGNLRIDAIDASVGATDDMSPVPVPAAIWSGASALLGLGLIGARNRRRAA